MWELKTFTDLLQVLVAVVLCLLALRRFGTVFYAYVTNPIKQAKRYSMTEQMVRYLNLLILVYALYLFYEAQLSLFQQPGTVVWKIGADLVTKAVFLIAMIAIVGHILGELQQNAGPGGAGQHKVRYLFKALNKRGFSVFEFMSMPILVGIKYYAQTMPAKLPLPVIALFS